MFKPAAKFTTLVLLTTAVATGSALAESTTAASSAASATTTSASHASDKLPRSDASFLKQAAQNGHAEIEGSKLALTKAVNPEVKTFAQTMIDEHTKAGDELKALATSKGLTVPDSPSLAQKAKLKLLSARDGASFDQHYADSIGVKAHQDTVKLFQKAVNESKDPDVKAFATKTLPVLQHHLAMARDLYANVHQGDKKK